MHYRVGAKRITTFVKTSSVTTIFYLIDIVLLAIFRNIVSRIALYCNSLRL